jgi:5'-deoxynucleotidase YfbR-like HD superfamily hydrolase
MEKAQSPEQHPPLIFAPFAPDTWAGLGSLKRTGWVVRGVANPETVQEHIISLMQIGASLDVPPEEKEGLLEMLEVHDWPEAIIGDEVIVTNDLEERARLKADKFKREQAALESICAGMPEKGDEVMAFWLRFEISSDPAAVLARQIDKYQAVEKALEYEKAQGIALFQEFLDHARSSITHPVLLEKIRKLEEEFAAL